jgi:C1A family cysteine protease
MIDKSKIKFGWLKDKPDSRDYKYTAKPEVIAVLPASADLRSSDTPILDQGSMGSCAAHAAVGVFEWLQKFKTGKYVAGSRMFIYKEARDIDGSTGDVGTYLRSVAAVMANEGVPPESIWGYSSSLLDTEPTTAVKTEAIKSHVDSYWRLDGGTQTETNNNIKAALATNGLPPMFGCTVYDSIFNTGSDGMVPSPGGSVAGGHAMDILGYDDAKQRFLIKNSWGTSWGGKCPTVQLPNGAPTSGYGWLGYNYDISDVWIVAKESQIQDTILTPTYIKIVADKTTAKVNDSVKFTATLST